MKFKLEELRLSWNSSSSWWLTEEWIKTVKLGGKEKKKDRGNNWVAAALKCQKVKVFFFFYLFHENLSLFYISSKWTDVLQVILLKTEIE